MIYKIGDIVDFKGHTAVIRFSYPKYKSNKDAYVICFHRKNGDSINKLCFEEELTQSQNTSHQISFFDESI